ncbi:MAG: MoaD/ThiS family protein [Promethearchaeota archaeon]
MRFKSFGPFRRALAGKVLEVDVPEGSTVQQVISRVIEIGGPEIERLIMDGGRISGNLIVMLNKKDVNTLGGIEVPVSENDEIAILPHVQGG